MDNKISIDVFEVKIDSVLDVISFKSGVLFSYNSDLFLESQKFTINRTKTRLSDLLDQLLVGTNVEYVLMADQIILKASLNTKSAVTLYDKVNIRGVVLDSITGMPVEGAHILIAGTLRGTISNFNGQFEFFNLKPGPMEFVVSHLSYKVKMFGAELTGRNKTSTMKLPLSQAVTQLRELEFTAISQAEWRKYYRIFQDVFIGRSTNSYECEVLNFDAIHFKYDEENDILEATASEPLIIENQALGYRITYFLQKFEYSDYTTQLIGAPSFEELTPGSARERKKWIRNRKTSYYGSMMHFLRLMDKGDLKKSGFFVHEVDDIKYHNLSNKYHTNPNAFIEKSEGTIRSKLKFSKYLLVEYARESPGQAYVYDQYDVYGDRYLLPDRSLSSLGQVSFIKLNLPEVTINSSGYIQEALAITVYGYWAWERLANALPLEYQPK